jgi:hypothetical protein
MNDRMKERRERTKSRIERMDKSRRTKDKEERDRRRKINVFFKRIFVYPVCCCSMPSLSRVSSKSSIIDFDSDKRKEKEMAKETKKSDSIVWGDNKNLDGTASYKNMPKKKKKK